MSATVRVLSPEEIAARSGGSPPRLRWPQRGTVFAERAMRLRQLASGHAMAEFLGFAAALAQAQQHALLGLLGSPARPGGLALPDASALDAAARLGQAPLDPTRWPRDPVWQSLLHTLIDAVADQAPAAGREVFGRLRGAEPAWLETQADRLLAGIGRGVDLACAPLIGAALQVLWTAQLLALQPSTDGATAPFGLLDQQGLCPCCGSRPVASVTRSSGESLGQRYLHCGLCNLEWHRVRIECVHCGGTQRIAYQSLDLAGAGADDEAGSRAAQAAVQAETCEDCGHYLKIVHSDRDPFVDPVADDLASLTLDLLLAEAGQQRHGLNLLLLFGEAGDEAPDPASHPPDPPGGA